MARDDSGSARQPWLEEADVEDTASSTLIGRRTVWALAIGLIGLIAGVALGVWLLGRQEAQPIDMLRPGAEVPLVRSPGPWKEAPTGPGTQGQLVPGTDQIAYDTATGADEDGKIALDQLPEAPLSRPGSESDLPDDTTGTEEDADTVAIRPVSPGISPAADTGKATPPAPPAKSETAKSAPVNTPVFTPVAPAKPLSAGGSTLQLGAFSSEARAREAWKSMSGRFPYLDGLVPVILPTSKEDRTLYRLRVSVADGPSAAREICGKLKVAMETCDIVR